MSKQAGRGLGLCALLYCGLGKATPPLHWISSVNYGSEITSVYGVAIWPALTFEGSRLRDGTVLLNAISSRLEPRSLDQQRRWTRASGKLGHF